MQNKWRIIVVLSAVALIILVIILLAIYFTSRWTAKVEPVPPVLPQPTPENSSNTPTAPPDDILSYSCKGYRDPAQPLHQVRKISATHHPWQWMVVLLNHYNKPFCGGALITHHHALTAAHCSSDCYNRKPIPITVRHVEHDNVTDEARHKDYEVQIAHCHPDYDYRTYKDDIAILVLKEKVSDPVQLATLAAPGPLYYCQEAIVTGFGADDSTTWEEIRVVVWDNEDCGDRYKEKNELILDTHLCASTMYGNEQVINGFSGGPLQLQLNTPTRGWEVVGIVSWWIPSFPVVYTRVNKYVDWINNTTKSAADDLFDNQPNTTKSAADDSFDNQPNTTKTAADDLFDNQPNTTKSAADDLFDNKTNTTKFTTND